MKNLILTLLAAALLLQSCRKEATPTPGKQTVTYNVSCLHCSIFVTDNHWNKPNDAQHFVVDGSFSYSFDNDSLSKASIEIYTGSFVPEIPVKATITTNDGRCVELNRTMGNGSKGNLIDTSIVLALK
ncbi:hypothetical protein [Mucilaginibacter sp. SP1R1]|uniref:hypothetical protein n=1 Tax=Mucilaginibacter sp. SP1R1 TaxID=2723091 RepID=UPI00160EBE2D|nr:hypothetical protein [Mucilaginibacter sp. SP1R1]MBB6149464.1 hypothetical protein [Mucilaginibacter sp. SP1R1]